MTRNVVRFVPNIPQQVALKSEGVEVQGFRGTEIMYSLEDGRLMFVSLEVAASIRNMGVKPGEPFSICKRWNGQKGRASVTRWDVWLASSTEQARAAEEIATSTPAEYQDLVPALQESIQIAERKRAVIPMPAPVEPLLATGTDGPQRRLAGSSKITFHEAFRETVGLVNDGLKANGEKWNDEARQGAVSTILISLSQMGMLTWGRL